MALFIEKPKRSRSSKIEDGSQPDTRPKEKQPGKAGSFPQKARDETFSSPTEFGYFYMDLIGSSQMFRSNFGSITLVTSNLSYLVVAFLLYGWITV